MKKIVSMLLVSVMCCGLLVGCKKVPFNHVELLHNTELYLDSTKKDIEDKERLTKNEYGNYKSNSRYAINGQKYDIIYAFDNDKIDYVMYCWERNPSDLRENTGILLLNYTRSNLTEKGWEDHFTDNWDMEKKTDFVVTLEYPQNSEGDKDRIMLLVKSKEALSNAEVEEKKKYFEDSSLNSSLYSEKDSKYSSKTTAINKTLSSVIQQEEYKDLIKNWSAIAHSLDNSCDISVEFQASADVRVGTVSAIRNKLSDIVLEELPEIKEISINFKGIGTYVFTVGTGWDKEVKADDNQ